MPSSVSLYALVSFRTFSAKAEGVRTVSHRFFCRFVQSAFRHRIEFRRSEGRVQLHNEKGYSDVVHGMYRGSKFVELLLGGSEVQIPVSLPVSAVSQTELR